MYASSILVPTIILIQTSFSVTFSFAPLSSSSLSSNIHHPLSSSYSNNAFSPSALFAKRGKRTTGSGGFGGDTSKGGFGGVNTKTKAPTSKTRSVSGYTGSGTKPLRIAANTFDGIRKKYGKEGTSDVYVRSPLNDKELCWFVGKVIRRTDSNDPELNGSSIPTEMEAVISQKRLILEYAKNQLRPQNFGGPYSKNLEVLIAPGDSEMDVVQNKVSLEKVGGSTTDLSDGFSVKDVGYNPEIYIGDEQNDGGLRVKRDENGHPVKEVFEIQ